MSIATALTKLETDISSAYNKIEEKGGTIPTEKNTNNLTEAIDSISGGGAAEKESKDVNFYTYDGTRVASYTKDEFLQLASMPSSPTYELMTSDGWNWTLSDAQAYVSTFGGLDIGDTCHTTDGTLKLFINLIDKNRLNLYLRLQTNGSLTVDWGDNTTSTLTGSNITVVSSTSHTYSSTGSYVISVSRNSTSTGIRFPRGTDDTCVMLSGSSSASSSTGINYFASTIKKVLTPNFVDSCQEYAFESCNCLESINIPNTISSVQLSAFKFCNSLKCLVLPTSNRRIYDSVCYMASNLKVFCTPKQITQIDRMCLWGTAVNRYWISDSVTTMANSAFESAYYTKIGLQVMTIPATIKSVPSYLFNYNYSLSTITFLGDITNIPGYCFTNCSSLKRIYFTNNTAVPTLNSNAFNTSSLPSDMRVVVPDALYDEWKTATNWSTISSKIVKASQA